MSNRQRKGGCVDDLEASALVLKRPAGPDLWGSASESEHSGSEERQPTDEEIAHDAEVSIVPDANVPEASAGAVAKAKAIAVEDSIQHLANGVQPRAASGSSTQGSRQAWSRCNQIGEAELGHLQPGQLLECKTRDDAADLHLVIVALEEQMQCDDRGAVWRINFMGSNSQQLDDRIQESVAEDMPVYVHLAIADEICDCCNIDAENNLVLLVVEWRPQQAHPIRHMWFRPEVDQGLGIDRGMSGTHVGESAGKDPAMQRVAALRDKFDRVRQKSKSLTHGTLILEDMRYPGGKEHERRTGSQWPKRELPLVQRSVL